MSTTQQCNVLIAIVELNGNLTPKIAAPRNDKEALFATDVCERLYSKMFGDYFALHQAIKPFRIIETLDEF